MSGDGEASGRPVGEGDAGDKQLVGARFFLAAAGVAALRSDSSTSIGGSSLVGNRNPPCRRETSRVERIGSAAISVGSGAPTDSADRNKSPRRSLAAPALPEASGASRNERRAMVTNPGSAGATVCPKKEGTCDGLLGAVLRAHTIRSMSIARTASHMRLSLP
eukprot:scaffold101400_cov30-Tisochrysis_lutea.AAC.5